MPTQELSSGYEVYIGLEVHAQLLTRAKIFAPEAVASGDEPNTQISVVSLAHPGTLPKLNKQAITYAIRMGLACNSRINRYTYFDRKNYFYPDLPKGYQLTQDGKPICVGGYISIGEGGKEVKLTKIHLEEDAGKSMHLAGEDYSQIDFNRAGTPLIEIVTEPVIRSAEEAYQFMVEVRRLVRYLEICDGNMEDGSLRCDVNISIKKTTEKDLGKKVEVKNLNSFSNIKKAIEFETTRQVGLLENNEDVISETRTYDATSGTTSGMRNKEELNDYRYFPEPDLCPIHISEEWLSDIERSMPELPWQVLNRLTNQFKLSDYDAQLIADDRYFAAYYFEVAKHCNHYKPIANWLMGPVKSYFNDAGKDVSTFGIEPAQLAALVNLVEGGKLGFSVAAKKLFPKLVLNPNTEVSLLATELGLLHKANTSELEDLIMDVLNKNPDKVKAYKNGKKNLLAMFIGQVMKRSQGKADPKTVNQLLLKMLN